MKILIHCALLTSGLLALGSTALAANAAIGCDNCTVNTMKFAARSKGVSLGNGRHRIQVGNPTAGVLKVYRIVVDNSEVGTREISSSTFEQEQWQTAQMVRRPDYEIVIPDHIAPEGHSTPGVFQATSAYLRTHPELSAMIDNDWIMIVFPRNFIVTWNDGYQAQFEYKKISFEGQFVVVWAYVVGSMVDEDGNPVDDWKEGPDSSPYEGQEGSTSTAAGLQQQLDNMFFHGVPTYVIRVTLPPNTSSTWDCTNTGCTLKVRL